MTEPADADLRLRYLDWCATQIARRFLQLSPDEVWERANASPAPPVAPDSYPPAVDPTHPPSEFLHLVRRSTLQIASELKLPPFEAWRELYLADPRRYDADIVGVRGGATPRP